MSDTEQLNTEKNDVYPWLMLTSAQNRIVRYRFTDKGWVQFQIIILRDNELPRNKELSLTVSELESVLEQYNTFRDLFN